MKVIKYNICNMVNIGTAENPLLKETLFPVEMGWNEVNEEIAKKEAYNGEYTIEDDGIEVIPEPTPEERIAALEEELAVAKILLGVE